VRKCLFLQQKDKLRILKELIFNVLAYTYISYDLLRSPLLAVMLLQAHSHAQTRLRQPYYSSRNR